jgi:hypothetical protein
MNERINERMKNMILPYSPYLENVSGFCMYSTPRTTTTTPLSDVHVHVRPDLRM